MESTSLREELKSQIHSLQTSRQVNPFSDERERDRHTQGGQHETGSNEQHIEQGTLLLATRGIFAHLSILSPRSRTRRFLCPRSTPALQQPVFASFLLALVPRRREP